MKNITKSILLALSFLALSNNVSAMDTALLNIINEISIDNVTDLEKAELTDKIESLNSILEISTENGSEEEIELVKAKINLLDQIMAEKYPTFRKKHLMLWKKVKTFVANHKLAVSVTAVAVVTFIIITTVLVKNNGKSEMPDDVILDNLARDAFNLAQSIYPDIHSEI